MKWVDVIETVKLAELKHDERVVTLFLLRDKDGNAEPVLTKDYTNYMRPMYNFVMGYKSLGDYCRGEDVRLASVEYIRLCVTSEEVGWLYPDELWIRQLQNTI